MTGVAAHAFPEPYIGVSATKVTNKLHPATFPPLPRPISSTPTLNPIRSHALFLPTIRTFSSTSTPYSPQLAHPYHHFHVSSLTHQRIPAPSTGRCPIAYTYSIPHIHENLQRITRTYLPIARTPPPTYTHLLPLLCVDAPSLIPIQSLTSTNIPTELRVPTSPSHALLPLLICTFSFSYA